MTLIYVIIVSKIQANTLQALFVSGVSCCGLSRYFESQLQAKEMAEEFVRKRETQIAFKNDQKEQ